MAMSEPHDRASRYRQREVDTRARADQIHDGRDRDLLLEVAAACERLADLENKEVKQRKSALG
jgi:hypothetical protein